MAIESYFHQRYREFNQMMNKGYIRITNIQTGDTFYFIEEEQFQLFKDLIYMIYR